MIKNYYLLFSLVILCIIFIFIYFNSIEGKLKEDGIIIINSNLKNYRIIPDDKGGLPQYDLDILNE